MTVAGTAAQRLTLNARVREMCKGDVGYRDLLCHVSRGMAAAAPAFADGHHVLARPPGDVALRALQSCMAAHPGLRCLSIPAGQQRQHQEQARGRAPDDH
jgi:hypothetical protein